MEAVQLAAILSGAVLLGLLLDPPRIASLTTRPARWWWSTDVGPRICPRPGAVSAPDGI
jgi:hypothetical protein